MSTHGLEAYTDTLAAELARFDVAVAAVEPGNYKSQILASMLKRMVPPRPDAGGLRLGDCNTDQVKAFCDLLATLFSEQGYAKMRNIMLADDQLLRGGRARPAFGTENFSVVLFGTPSATEPWAFQLDGHHVGVNLAIHGGNERGRSSFPDQRKSIQHTIAYAWQSRLERLAASG